MSVSPPTTNELHWLVCPACHQALQMDVAEILCLGCGRRYPVVDGIPVLLEGRVVEIAIA